MSTLVAERELLKAIRRLNRIIEPPCIGWKPRMDAIVYRLPTKTDGRRCVECNRLLSYGAGRRCRECYWRMANAFYWHKAARRAIKTALTDLIFEEVFNRLPTVRADEKQMG
jgi:hypothetical protein